MGCCVGEVVGAVDGDTEGCSVGYFDGRVVVGKFVGVRVVGAEVGNKVGLFWRVQVTLTEGERTNLSVPSPSMYHWVA